MILRERPVSRHSREVIGFCLYIDGVLDDPDPGTSITVDISHRDSGRIVTTGAVTERDDQGLYSFVLPPSATSEQGDYTVVWHYIVDEEPLKFVDEYQVYETMPFWDSFDLEQKTIVMNIYHKVSHTFDSVEGGPYLWEILQSNFNAYETIARLMTVDAMTYINFAFQPAFDPPFVIGNQQGRVYPEKWYGLIERAGYVEFLKHLSRSYIEQPDNVGVDVAYLDRRKYRQMWQEEYRMEKEVLDQMLKQFKRKFLVRTKRSWIISGGTVGRFFPNTGRPSWIYRH